MKHLSKAKTAVVTGANSGIGLATAVGTAQRGYRTVLVCRSADRAAKAKIDIEAAVPGAAVEIQTCDLASQASVRAAAAELLQRYDAIEVLINNAGLWLKAPEKSVDGLDMVFAVNHLGPFLLTNLLLDRMRESAPARIVTVSSSAHRYAKLCLDDLHAAQRFGHVGTVKYSQTKLMNILFTRELARRLAGSGVTANCVQPGAVRTNLVGASKVMNLLVQWFCVSPEVGARSSLSAATDERWAELSGAYLAKSEPADNKLSAVAKNDVIASRLWDLSATLAPLGASRAHGGGDKLVDGEQ